MPNLLTANMRALLASDAPVVFPFAEVYLPGSTAGSTDLRYWASHPLASATLGPIEGRVLRWNPIRYAVSDRDNALQYATAGLAFEDTDFQFAKKLEGPQGHRLRGCRARIRLAAPPGQTAAPSLTPSDWPTLFDGLLDDWPQESALIYGLSFRLNDQPLRSKFPKTQILPSDWPAIGDRTLYSSFVPIIYGIHDSRNIGDNGAVPCLYVDRIGFRYLVAQGYVTVNRVYKNGALESGSLYTITRPTINGRLYTLIDYTADPNPAPPAAQVAITADVTGYESTGDGSGSLLTGADAMQHLLVNFAYGDYQGGNWASVGSVPVSSSHFTAVQTFLAAMGWQKVSRRYGGATERLTVEEAFNEWCRSVQIASGFTRDGKVAVWADDHRALTLWYDAPRILRFNQEEVGESFNVRPDRARLSDRIAVKYLLSSSKGDYVQTLEVADLAVGEEAASDLDLPWSSASAV